jgi:sulfatase maturation enzyme AslB (radical SAM superfamily)
MRLINPEVRIETSSVCNARCSICPRERMTRPKVVMDYIPFVDLLLQSQGLGAKTISLFGYGEPLCDKGLEQKLWAVTDVGLESFITTNGALLHEGRSRHLLRNGLTHIRFSVHGLTKETYEDVHRSLHFADVFNNISDFIWINDTEFDHSCKVSVSVIPMHGETVEDIRDFWEPAVDYLEIWKPHNWAGGRDFRSVKAKKKTCGRPFTGPLQINADGKMMVCCFDTDAKMTVGDTNEKSIRDILRGKAFEKIREAHMTGDLTGLPCETCDQLNEGDNPLLYSSRDPERRIGCTSSTKFEL